MNVFLVFPLFLLFWVDIIESSVIPTAHFENNGLSGFVAMFQGKMWYELDFSGIDFDLLPANCSEDSDLLFHLHSDWTYGDDSGAVVDRMLEECSSNFTGGTYDPWFACGPYSDSPDCEVNGGCIPPSSIFETSDLYIETYVCDPTNYDIVSYACETGDYSGKYGELDPFYYSNITNETEGELITGVFGSYWELQEETLTPELPRTPAMFSVVIHCSDGTPLFCAPVLRDTSREAPPLDLTDSEIIEISFEEAGEEYATNDFENFTISWSNQGVTFDIPESVGTMCAEWYLRLYESYPFYEGPDAVGAAVDCDVGAFGGIYDPTHTCVEDSGSLYCIDGRRCNVTDANYDCSGQFRGCAVGDVSARIGTIVYDTVAGGHQTILMEDPQSPPLFILDQRGIVMECLENITITGIANICAGTTCDNCTTIAPITNVTSAPTQPTSYPTRFPTTDPTTEPTVEPTRDPTAEPTTEPTSDPTVEPTAEPTVEPTSRPGPKGPKPLETGAVVGIAIGGVLLLVGIGALIFFLVSKKGKEDETGTAAGDHAEMAKMKSASADADGDADGDADETDA